MIGPGHGGVGILTVTNRQADDVQGVLRDAGIPAIMLKEYSVRTSDAVRVGTLKRAKGLEFKQVMLAHVDRGLVDAAPAESSESDRERRERGRRKLYVGMTWARDGLWVGVRSGVARSR